MSFVLFVVNIRQIKAELRRGGDSARPDVRDDSVHSAEQVGDDLRAADERSEAAAQRGQEKDQKDP